MSFIFEKVAPVALGLAALASLQGCQTYKSLPVDLDSYSQQWAEQSMTDETLVEFANGLIGRQSPQGVFDVTDGISLPEAQLISLLFNPQLSKSRLESRLPLTRKKRSALLPDPEIELDFEPVTNGLDDDWLLNAQLGFAIPLSFRIGAEMNKIDSEYQAELLNLLNAEQQAVSRVHDLWVQLSAIEKKQRVLGDHLSGLEEVIEQAGQALSLTSMSASDLQSLALEAATVQADLLTLREQRVERFIALATEMGLKADTPLQFQFSIPAADSPVAREQWQALLVENDAELLLARARYQVAEHNLELEIKKQYPDLVVGPIYQQGVSSLGLNFASLLPIWNRNLPAIEGAKLEREAAGKELQRIYQQKINTLQGIEQRLALLDERERFFNERLAPMIDQQFENIWQSIQLGAANVLLLQDTLRQRLNSKLDMLDTIEKSTILKNRMMTMLAPVHSVPVSAVPQRAPSSNDNPKNQGE